MSGRAPYGRRRAPGVRAPSARFLGRIGARGIVGLGLAATCWLVSGCASQGLQLDDLPRDPIAFVYWQPEEARRRAELIEKAQNPAAAAQAGQPSRRGIARMEGLRSYLGGRGASAEATRYPGRLSVLDPHTRSVRRLDAAPPGARPLAWSDDRTRLLFSSAHETGSYRLYEYHLEHDEVRPMTFGDEHSFVGDFGPDDRLAYAALRAEGGAIRARVYVTRDGGQPPRMVADQTPVENVRWSPNGDVVVYARRALPKPGASARNIAVPTLVARPADGSGGERTLGPGRDPIFTPDGEWIIYTAPSSGRWRLRRMRPDGTGRSFLGEGNFEEGTPAVSRDGRFVAYVAGEAGSERLFVRRIDGSGDRVLFADGALISPVW